MGDLVRLVDYKKKKREREELCGLFDDAEEEQLEAYLKLFQADANDDNESTVTTSVTVPVSVQHEDEIDYDTCSYTQLILTEQAQQEIIDAALAHFDTVHPPNSGE